MPWWLKAALWSVALFILTFAVGITHTDVVLAGQITRAQGTAISSAYGVFLGVALCVVWVVAFTTSKRDLLLTQLAGGVPRSGYAPCPLCSSSTAAPVGYSLWGGILGPKLLTHVKCSECGTTYNGKTGLSNATGITVYVVVSTIFAFVLISAALRIVLPMVGSLVPN